MDYPFVKCLHPVKVRNPYTGDYIITPCGKCKCCLVNKASQDSLQCTLEESHHQYCYFITLTYNNDCIPLAQPVFDADSDSYVLYNCSLRFKRLGEKIGYAPVSKEYMANFLVKTKLNGLIGYANILDFQLFMKRFRYYLTKYFINEKVRYYAVSEYGPKTFRPHFHILLFFDSPRLAQRIGRVVRQSWPFGIVDYSLSRSACSSYVASYVNSTACLPSFLALCSSKPFKSHSVFFGQELDDAIVQKAQEDPTSFVGPQSRQFNGADVNYHLWRSYKNRLFPRCVNYAFLSHREKCRSYSILREVFAEYGHMSIKDLAECIFNSDLHNPVYDFFYYYENPEQIASHLYLSSAFLNRLCHGSTSYHVIDKCVSCIELFYNELDYSNLVNWYSVMESYSKEFKDTNLDLFYDNGSFYNGIYRESPLFSRFVETTLERYNKSIKHKELNDLNGYFVTN